MPRLTLRRATTSLPMAAGTILLGFGIGVVAGFLLGELGGPVPLRSLTRVRPTGAQPRSVVGLVKEARAALDGDLRLRDCRLTVVPFGPGRIELHGWVDDRAARARAERLVRGAVRAEAIINCVMVHGEDDASVPNEPGTDELLA